MMVGLTRNEYIMMRSLKIMECASEGMDRLEEYKNFLAADSTLSEDEKTRLYGDFNKTVVSEIDKVENAYPLRWY